MLTPLAVRFIYAIAYIVLAPFIGGLLEGIGRKISARMQRRVGPPLLQPFYDISKLLKKKRSQVTRAQGFLLTSYMLLIIFTGAMLFFGTDMLMCFLMLSTAALFLYLAGCVTTSPYSSLGAQRELIQEMAYEPAILLTALGFYLAVGSFDVEAIHNSPVSPIMIIPGFFVAFVFILTIKMRKSPFDESTSHHPHQELVKGLTSEMSGRNLAIFNVTEWYETVFLLAVVFLFIKNSSAPLVSGLVGIGVVLLTYFLEILIDNTSARVHWERMLTLTWAVTLCSCGVNLLVLMIVR